MTLPFTFKNLQNNNPLIVLDLANNHNGSVSHAKKIIDEAAVAVRNSGVDFQIAIKFQYRNLPDFIEKKYQDRSDIKYVNRFLSTKLSWHDFMEIKEYVSSKGFLTACTPFDEFSVEKVIEHSYDILKIASASFTDWPLLEKVVLWNGPIIASTAGATVSEIDRVVTFFSNRNKEFALMHCVAIYPTDDDDLNLNRISSLINRYGNIPIGFSTHENPNNHIAGPMALAAGAKILEKHIGSSAAGQTLNKYSSDGEQMEEWFNSLNKSRKMLGGEKPLAARNESEIASLRDLRRFAFAKHKINKDKIFNLDDVYFAIPGEDNQIQANDFGKYTRFLALKELLPGDSVTSNNSHVNLNESTVFGIRQNTLKIIADSGIVVPKNSELEISHHYGLESFQDFGSVMITVINRDYCKKLIFLQPNQYHPEMFHKVKDETFFILYGEVNLKLDGKLIVLKEGDSISIPPNSIHGFGSKNGAIIEEVSSNHQSSDSYYLDEKITDNKNRKTIVHYWL